MDAAICLMAGAILTFPLLCRACVDRGALMDRLNAIDDNTVAYIDPGLDHDIRPDGLPKLHLFLESPQFWRFGRVCGILTIVAAIFSRV